MTQKKLSGAASIKRLKRALLDTKMANELFVDQIAEGAVTAEYAAQAFKNYAEWLASQHDALPTKERFVVGFVFSKNPERILLVLKNRPAWQSGKFNGIGGKIENFETPLEAMNREFVEETYFSGWLNHVFRFRNIVWEPVGLKTKRATIESDEGSYEVHVFAAMVDDVRELVFEGQHLVQPKDFEVPVWQVPNDADVDPNREIVFALPLNREILYRRGIPGLAGLVDLAIKSYEDGSFTTIVDAA